MRRECFTQLLAISAGGKLQGDCQVIVNVQYRFQFVFVYAQQQHSCFNVYMLIGHTRGQEDNMRKVHIADDNKK